MTPNASGAQLGRAAPSEAPSSARFRVYQPALPVERRRRATPREQCRNTQDAQAFFARFG
jgi:hypothetical protein